MEMTKTSILIFILLSYWLVLVNGTVGQQQQLLNVTALATCNFTACNAQRTPCSSNVDCECLSITTNATKGICGSALCSCSSVVRCNPDNVTCPIENTICINSTRCGGPVCYPLAFANKLICPKIATVTVATPNTTTVRTSTTSKINTTMKATVSSTKSSTTTTAGRLPCPSAFWAPNAVTVAGSASGASGSTTGLLNIPYDITTDLAFNIYISDHPNNRVMKWTQNSMTGEMIGPQLGYGVGSDTNHLYHPTTQCFDSTQSNLYISDSGNCRILKLNIVSNTITVAVGGTGCGSALNQFHYCDGLYVDRNSNLYLADHNNARVLKFPPNSNSTTMGTIVAGNGTAGSALNQLDITQGIYVDESDGDTLYVVDHKNHRVMKWPARATNGAIVAGGNGVGALYTQFDHPVSVFVDSFKTIYVSDFYNHRIVKWLHGASSGTLIAGISNSIGTASNQLNNPRGIRFDTNGNLYVTDSSNNRVQRFTINRTTC